MQMEEINLQFAQREHTQWRLDLNLGFSDSACAMFTSQESITACRRRPSLGSWKATSTCERMRSRSPELSCILSRVGPSQHFPSQYPPICSASSLQRTLFYLSQARSLSYLEVVLMNMQIVHVHNFIRGLIIYLPIFLLLGKHEWAILYSARPLLGKLCLSVQPLGPPNKISFLPRLIRYRS